MKGKQGFVIKTSISKMCMKKKKDSLHIQASGMLSGLDLEYLTRLFQAPLNTYGLFVLKKYLSNLPNTLYNSEQLELNLLLRELQARTDLDCTLQ